MEKNRSLDFMHKISNILLSAVTVFGILLPVAGFAYSYGYNSIFGMDANSFPMTIGDLWQYSFIMSFLWVAPILKMLIIIFIPVLTVFFLLGLIHSKLTKAGKLPISEEKYQAIFGGAERFTASLQKILGDDSKFFKFSGYALLITIMFFGIFLLYPYHQGGNFAQKHLGYYLESGCASENWSNCASYHDPNDSLAQSYSGLLISTSTTHIAIFDGKNLSIVPRKPEYVLTKGYKTPDEQAEETDTPDK